MTNNIRYHNEPWYVNRCPVTAGYVDVPGHPAKSNYWGRIGFDRIDRNAGGVSWLVSGPRKKLTKLLIAKDNSFALAA